MIATLDDVTKKIKPEPAAEHQELPVGAPGNLSTLVDEGGRVLGVEDLRVADGSVFPWVPSGNTNLSSVLAGEKIAELTRYESARAVERAREADR